MFLSCETIRRNCRWNRKVVITGGSGFIGTNLTLHFAENEPRTKVVILDINTPQVVLPDNAEYRYGDIRNLNSLLDAFDGAEEVYNLAGILGTSELIPISSLATDINVTGAANVLDAARRCKVKRVYNVAKPHFVGFHENTYTLTKHAAEYLGLLYRDKYGMEIATVRWMNAVGPYQHLYPIRKFVPTMILFALAGVDLEIYGSGEQTIDPIDSRDMCDYTVYACRHLGKEDTVIDLGSGEAVTCNRAVEVILDIVQKEVGAVKSKVVHLPMREGEGPNCHIEANNEYWRSIGMLPKHSFEDSVRSALEFIHGLPHHELVNALRFYGKPASGLSNVLYNAPV